MNAPRIYTPTKVERGGDLVIITLGGGAIREVENVIAGELEGLTDEPGPVHMLLDFANVGFVGSAELGTLVGLHKKLRAAGGRLTLFNLRDDVFEVFTTTRLDTLIRICRERPPVPPVN